MKKWNMTLRRVLILTLLLLTMPALPASAWVVNNAREYGVTLFSKENGIPTGEASAVLQTEDGFVWIGGFGGLQRYDGVSFRQMGEEEGLTARSVRALWESPEGELWVGTYDQGAFYRRDGRFHRVETRLANRDSSVRCFAQAPDGTVWMGTSDGLAYLEDGVLQHFDMTDFGHRNSVIFSVCVDGEGLLWAVDYAGSLLAVDTGTRSLRHYYRAKELWGEDGTYAYQAILLRDGRLAVGMLDNRICFISGQDTGAPRIETVRTGKLYAINCLFENSRGQIWACGDGGLGVVEPDGSYTELSDYPHADHLRWLCQDHEGGVWVASTRCGALHIMENRVALLPLEEDPRPVVNAVSRSRGQTYLATNQGLRVRDDRWQPVENSASRALGDLPLGHVVTDRKDRLWICGYYGGLYLYDPAGDSLTQVMDSDSRVRLVRPLSDGTVAVSLYGGICIFRDTEMISRHLNKGALMLSITETSQGSLLCGSDGKGIYELKDGQFRLYADRESGLPGGVVLRVVEDPLDRGHYWISCGYDLVYGNREEGFRTAALLNQSAGGLLAIVPDGGNIWLLRSGGVVQKMDRRLLLAGWETEPAVKDVLDGADGLKGSTVPNSWGMRVEDELWVCTTEGVGCIDMHSEQRTVPAPPIAITDIACDGVCRREGDTVRLHRDARKLTVSMAALSYTADDALMEYWLEGFDSGYTKGTVRDLHDIRYTNLPGGSYTLHIRASSGPGQPISETSLQIVKELKLSETLWMPVLLILGAALVTTLVIWAIFRSRVRYSREKQKLYKSIMAQSIATIAGAVDAKDPYTQGHSRRVAEFSAKLGRRLGLNEEDCERLFYIAQLHDIGKIGIPDHILKKPGRLTEEEYAIIKRHTEIGGAILQNFTALEGVSEGALYHHERYDGKGYCRGLSGEHIPYFARIIAVADAYDAMNSDRYYRRALSREQIIGELKKGRGTQFDPHMADVAVAMLEQEGRSVVEKSMPEEA